MEMSRRYEGLQREADASADALLRARADLRQLQGTCAEQRQQLAEAQAEASRLSAALQAAKVRWPSAGPCKQGMEFSIPFTIFMAPRPLSHFEICASSAGGGGRAEASVGAGGAAEAGGSRAALRQPGG